MSKRKDGFRPSVINPAEFVFVAQHYLGHSEEAWEALCNEMAEEAERLEAHMLAHPGHTVAGHKWAGQCDCCGARYLYGATFHTATSNTYISIGGICAGKMNLGNPAAMKTFREQINTHKLHMASVAKARAFAEPRGILAAVDLYLSKDNSMEFPERTLRDIVSKLVRWGELSDAQVAFAVSLLAQIADRPRILAEREARDAARKPIPAFIKRVTIEGVVVSAKAQMGGYSDQGFYKPECVKIVVEHADGWKVWGTAPADMGPGGTDERGFPKYYTDDERATWLKGKRVRFDARITVSDNDSKFGFFKRPTKAAVLDAAPVEAVAA